jgi:radical SAM superfamily enzyme YgiQ (UPF0313 family)
MRPSNEPMNILLINPPSDHIISTTQAKYIISERGLTPPLGLLYLASAVQRYRQHRVKILDCQVERLTEPQIRKAVIDFKPDVVGVTMITFMLVDCLRVIDIVKDCQGHLNKKMRLVAGGPHVSIFREETARFPGVDFALAGEAEFSFLDLLDYIDDTDRLEKIPGICFYRNGRLHTGPPYGFIDDLDSIPFPNRTLVDYRRYGNVLTGNGIMTTMMTSRGCPYRCIFCDRLGKKFRAISAGRVVEEIEHCLSLGINQIFFHDDTFTVDKKRVLDICRLIHDRRLRFSFSLRSRVNTIDEEMISGLKKAGCERISFGVESGVQRILNRIKKGITLQQAETAFYLARKYKIISLADFMIGHPDETVEDIEETIQFAKRLKPDYTQFSVTTPYPGTELYREGMQRGIIERDVWLEFAQNPTRNFAPPRWEETIDRDTLYALLHRCYREFYLRPGFILRNLVKIRDIHEFMRKVRAGGKLVMNEFLYKTGSRRDGLM